MTAEGFQVKCQIFMIQHFHDTIYEKHLQLGIMQHFRTVGTPGTG